MPQLHAPIAAAPASNSEPNAQPFNHSNRQRGRLLLLLLLSVLSLLFVYISNLANSADLTELSTNKEAAAAAALQSKESPHSSLCFRTSLPPETVDLRFQSLVNSEQQRVRIEIRIRRQIQSRTDKQQPLSSGDLFIIDANSAQIKVCPLIGLRSQSESAANSRFETITGRVAFGDTKRLAHSLLSLQNRQKHMTQNTQNTCDRVQTGSGSCRCDSYAPM